MILTTEILKEWEACEEAVSFFDRNFPCGLDLDKFKIEGDYNSWIAWLNEKMDGCEYDEKGNLTKRIEPEGRIWQWEYDSQGNLTKKIEPNGNIWQREYDKKGNLIKHIGPNGKIWKYKHDNKGNIVKKVEPNGMKLVYEYKHDSSGMLIEIKQNGGIILEIKAME